jgi:L,D-transpeptidase YcbB
MAPTAEAVQAIMNWRFGRRQLVWLAAFAMLLAGCTEQSRGGPSVVLARAGSAKAADLQLSPEAQSELRAYLAAGEMSDLERPDFHRYQTAVKEFYERTDYSLPWVIGQKPSAQASAVIATLENAENKGLNPVDYDGGRWGARLLGLQARRVSEDALVRFDLALTISTMRYVSDLHRGRVNPQDFHFDLDLTDKKIDLSEFLSKDLIHATDVHAEIAAIEPPFPQYRQTVDALQTYMGLARQDSGEKLPMPKKPVKPGQPYAGIPRLTEILERVGDLRTTGATASDDTNYGEILAAAVKHYQQRHGLDPDGVLDERTVQELNTPLAQRVTQLELTLERWRWLPYEFARPPIVVNIPEFRLYAVNGKYRPVLTMKVVVGRAYRHKTPVFASNLKGVIFRPYWNVPLSIARAELLPDIRKNPSYLAKNSYEVVDRSDNVVSEGPVTEEMEEQIYSGKLAIRQRPGPDNALGLIKFDLPNVYDVYMHGTPAMQLFSRSRRDFSHGCIRVEDPVALAAWVLRDQTVWDVDHILAAMNGEETFRVSLTKPIPVLILYGTAIVAEDGEVHFFRDIYGYDAELERVLTKGYPYSAE